MKLFRFETSAGTAYVYAINEKVARLMLAKAIGSETIEEGHEVRDGRVILTIGFGK